MTHYFSFLRRKLSIVTIAMMMFSQFSFLGINSVFAFTSTFGTNVTTANVVEVTEVKASHTLTVNALPLDAESITIGSCVVMFFDFAATWDNSATTDDVDCAWWTWSISNYTLVNPGVARTPWEIADVLDALVNVSDVSHGSLTVWFGAGTTTIFTTSWAESSATTIDFIDATAWDITATTIVTWVLAVAPVAQVVDFTPSSPTNGETYRATINSSDYDYTVTGSQTVQQVVEALQPLIDANAAVTCGEDDTKITCTAVTSGTAFTFAATIVDITNPVISQITPVAATGNDATPNYTFFSNEEGTISYGWSCSSITTLAITWSNIITLDTLADGTYSDCTITVTDSWSNVSNILTGTAFTIDATVPTVVLTSSAPSPTNGDFTVTATFSEAVTWVTGVDFIATNATTSVFTVVSPTVYRILVSPSANGPVTVNMPASAAMDSFANNSTAAIQLSVTYDGTDPSVVLSSTAPAITNAPFTVLATFSEAVTWVTSADFAVTNGVKTNLVMLSATGYTILVTPSSNGLVTINMAIDKAQDLAGNGNTAATQISRTYDINAPVVTLSWSASLTIAHGSVFSDAGATWTDNVDGSGIISVATSGTVNANQTGTYTLEYTYTDVAWNTGNTVTRTVTVADQTAPVVTLSWSASMSIIQWGLYAELGASRTDAIDGSGNTFSGAYSTTWSFALTGTVNTAIIWTYIVSYRKIDTSGNSSTVNRTIIITAPGGGGWGGGWGGWGGSSWRSTDDCPGKDTSGSRYDGECWDSVVSSTWSATGTIIPVIISETELPTIEWESTVELDENVTAYEFAYDYGMTTMTTIENAQLDGLLIRSHFAKMISNYAINVIGLEPDTSKSCLFDDLADQDVEMKGYIKTACQLGLMGVNTTSFNPNGLVTRAQTATIISRMYGWATDGLTYYMPHLAALKSRGIITIDVPSLIEKRWYIFLMLQRISEM